MTTLIAWVGVDPRGTSSVYVASDSRISFEPADADRSHVVGRLWWNSGVKIFACRNSPDIFAFCGDVLFPALSLHQFSASADAGLILSPSDDSHTKNVKLERFLKESYSRQNNAPNRDFTVVHVSRDSSGMSCSFTMCAIYYIAKSRTWNTQIFDLMLGASGLIEGFGSGAAYASCAEKVIRQKAQGGTSRSIFWAFCDHLKSCVDPMTGGGPQLAAVFRSGMPKLFGVVFEGDRFYLGSKLKDISPARNVEWRDELFQRVDGVTMKLLPGAQPHGR